MTMRKPTRKEKTKNHVVDCGCVDCDYLQRGVQQGVLKCGVEGCDLKLMDHPLGLHADLFAARREV